MFDNFRIIFLLNIIRIEILIISLLFAPYLYFMSFINFNKNDKALRVYAKAFELGDYPVKFDFIRKFLLRIIVTALMTGDSMQEINILNGLKELKEVYNAKIKSKEKTKKQDLYKSKEQRLIANIYLNKRDDVTANCTILLLTSILIYLGTEILFKQSVDYSIIIFIILIILILLGREQIIKYRINKDYYGDNYNESMEIIKYIVKNIDKDIPPGGNKKFYKNSFLPTYEERIEEDNREDGGVTL